jgi:hypothetical protein
MVAGTGLFATALIPRGQLIWELSERNCRFYRSAAEVNAFLDSLNPDEVRDFLTHAYVDDDVVIDIQDNGRYWNHSRQAIATYLSMELLS